MRQSKLLATQLQKRDPDAWTALLRDHMEVENLVVTAVSTKTAFNRAISYSDAT